MECTDIQRKKPGRPSKCPDPRILADLYREHTAKEIGDMYGVTDSRVRAWLKEARSGIDDFPGRTCRRPDGKVLAELYSSHTAGEIAEMYGVPVNTVRSWIGYYRKAAKKKHKT